MYSTTPSSGTDDADHLLVRAYEQDGVDVVVEAQRLAERASVQRGRLLAFVLDCLPATDWADAKAVAQAIWTLALEQSADFFEPVTTDAESGLASPLLSAARTVLRLHLHPAPDAVPAGPEQRSAPRRRLSAIEQHFVEQYAVCDRPLADAA